MYTYWNDDDNGCSNQGWGYQRTSDGVLLTFGLQQSANQCGFTGDLTIDWGVSEAPASRKIITEKRVLPGIRKSPGAEAPEEDGDAELKAKIDKLDPRARELLYQQLKKLAYHHNAQIKPGSQNTAALQERLKATPSSLNYGKDLKSVPETSPKKTKRREFILAFLKAHGVM